MANIEKEPKISAAQNATTRSENTANRVFFPLQAACYSQILNAFVKNTFIYKHYA